MEMPLSRSTTVTEEEPLMSGFEDESEGLTTKQKLALGFIWLVAGVYSVLSNSILSKGHSKVQISCQHIFFFKFATKRNLNNEKKVLKKVTQVFILFAIL